MTSRLSRSVTIAALVAAAVGAYSLLTSDPAVSQQQPMSAAARIAISQVSAFQDAERAADTVPGETMLTGVIRRVGAASSTQPVWASVDATEVCVQVGKEGAMACDTPERIESEPLIVGSRHGLAEGLVASKGSPPPAQEWAGVAIDGVEAIDVTYGDGATEVVPVVDNGFYMRSGGREVKAFQWTSNGEVHSDPEAS